MGRAGGAPQPADACIAVISLLAVVLGGALIGIAIAWVSSGGDRRSNEPADVYEPITNDVYLNSLYERRKKH
jgi:hypothetical protein